MVTIVGSREVAPEIATSMHDFRHEILVRRLGWSLPMIEGVERDEYDNDKAIYFVVREPLDNVTACARLLPTTERCVLNDLFPALLGGNPPPCDPAIWELSHFATSVRKSSDGRVVAFSKPTLDLLAALLEYGRERKLQRLILVTSGAIERLLIRAGIEVHRLAAPCRTPDGLMVALFIEIDSQRTDECDRLHEVDRTVTRRATDCAALTFESEQHHV